MIRPLPWYAVPATPLKDVLREFMWKPTSLGPPSSEVAALMVFVALTFSRRKPMEYLASASYTDLVALTGLSRSLVARGLARLKELGLIRAEGSQQNRQYTFIRRPEETGSYRHAKLPCRAILSLDQQHIKPFQALTLRSKHELNALKMYLYFALIREGHLVYSSASYETIHARIGVPERDIRRALSMLLAIGLLHGIDREHSAQRKVNEANKYYLFGYSDLFAGLDRITDPTSESAPAEVALVLVG